MKTVVGKIILVDDEPHEKEFLEIALKRKDWDIYLEYFDNVMDAMEHLKSNVDEIFLIISDMDMPKHSGIDFKEMIEEVDYLKQKSIPFIFISNSISSDSIVKAYQYNVQGYFQKPMTPEEQAKMFEIIIQYWKACLHPLKRDLPVNPF